VPARHFLVGADHDDLVQEGMLGLCKAIRDFDSRAGGFAAFATVCVHRQVMSAIRAASRQKHGPLNSYVSFSGPGPEDSDGKITVAMDTPARSHSDPAESVIARERLRALQRHVESTLSNLETQVLQLRVEGRGQTEIAKHLQRHAKAVDNALQRVRRKVEDHLEAWELEAAG
jgi:RNA polymerase sporulation-specific sigma factor